MGDKKSRYFTDIVKRQGAAAVHTLTKKTPEIQAATERRFLTTIKEVVNCWVKFLHVKQWLNINLVRAIRHIGLQLWYLRQTQTQRHTHTRLTAVFPGLPGWAGTRKAKPIWILLKQETVSSSGISWAICKSAPSSRQITMPAPHHSVFLQAGCPSCCPINSVKALKVPETHQ